MLIFAVILICLVVTVAVATRLSHGADDTGGTAVAKGDCSTCNGDNSRCMNDCMLEAAVNAPDYYDDEELDMYAGRRPDSYTDEEAEQFREVMLTMQPHEVAGWNRSLTLRGIAPPDQIKDEMLLLMGG
ncbi:MAG: hypothetical protein ACI4TW_06740 [Prevotella sp.]